jgi:hypothetical protein
MVGATIGLCLVSVAYAFMLNPTTAELGNAVDRRGLTCYSAVYAIYNIAYSLGMMSTDAFASAAASSLGFLPTLLCVGTVLSSCLSSAGAAPCTAPVAGPRL